MIYGELARYPLYITVKTRMISFWIKLLKGKETKLSRILYNFFLHKSALDIGANFKWIRCIQNILQECGFNYIWLSQKVDNEKWLISAIKQNLNDQFQQKWSSDCNASSKGMIYNLFTSNIFKARNYLEIIVRRNMIHTLVKFRTSNHRLPIETGRWSNIPRNQRICMLCKEDIGDEFHYIMTCSALNDCRKYYLPAKYTNTPNTLKFFNLFSCKKISVLRNLAKFIDIICKRVNSSG